MPSTVEEKPHCGERQSWSSGTYCEASSILRLSSSFCSRSPRFVPKGKQVVLGLVTTKHPELERKDDLKRRIDEAAKFVPLEQLCLSPQCGFSSTVEGNVLNPYQEVDKLRLVVDVARDVWGDA